MRSEFWLLTPAELAFLTSDWRLEQQLHDLRAAYAPYVIARTNGNKGVELKDFLATGPAEPAGDAQADDPDAMANAFRKFAALHNAEVARQEAKTK